MAFSASSTPGASTSSAHLTYPTPTPRSASPPPAGPRELHKNRLYVGNLHSSVDEYTFLQVFSKYGKIARLDYLFHKTGPSKGKPRGYAFVEYSEKDDANKALVNAHDKLLRGRKLVVTFAHQAPNMDGSGGTGTGSRPYYRKGASETNRPTALSLMKTTPRVGKTEDKIAALEAKLNQMQKSSEASPSPSVHPSLPPKPPPPLDTGVRSAVSSAQVHSRSKSHRTMNGGNGPGKKPTLEELMKGGNANGIIGLLKRP